MKLLILHLDTTMESCWIGLQIWILSIAALEADYLNKPQEFCEFDVLSASCQSDEVLVMEEALYGRMSLGRCVQADLGFVGCYADVLDIADQLCSGRRQCEVSIPNRQMKAKVKCLINELTSYLTASFSCHKAVSIDQTLCRKCDFIRVSEPFGIIASVVTQESKCGSAECPWLITVPKGQRINMTLLNFGWGLAGDSTVQHRFMSEYNCRTVLATLKESGQGPKRLCNSGERERHVYTSSSNSVEVRMVGRIREDRPLHFLLRYQAVGCTDPQPPKGGWIQRTGDTVTVGCNESSDTTQWLCTNNQWEGKTLDCTKELLPSSVGYVKVGGMSLPFGWSVAVVVFLAFIIGLIILSVGLFITKRWRARRRNTEEPIYQPPPYLAPNYRDPPPYYDKTTTNQRQQSGPREENGYTHIWQRPLPAKPEESSHPLPQQDPAYVQEPGSVHYGYNSIASVPRAKPKGKSRDTSFALAIVKDNSSRNVTSQDCRYFQLDPDKMSNHVSA